MLIQDVQMLVAQARMEADNPAFKVGILELLYAMEHLALK